MKHGVCFNEESDLQVHLAWWLQFDSHPRQLLEISYGVELLMALVIAYRTSSSPVSCAM
jgi:hypothetical protein